MIARLDGTAALGLPLREGPEDNGLARVRLTAGRKVSTGDEDLLHDVERDR
jgi:hypothetical protein